jgi:hypothetical protein
MTRGTRILPYSATFALWLVRSVLKLEYEHEGERRACADERKSVNLERRTLDYVHFFLT